MLETGLYNEIKNDATISAKLVDGAIYHIYPLEVPANVSATKAVTYTEITQKLSFPNARVSIFQINCIADTYDDARDLALDIDRIFNDRREYLLGGTFGVKKTLFYNRTVVKDSTMSKFIYVVEISIKY